MISIDASVAAKWFLKYEEGSVKAKGILENHILGNDIIIVPDFFIYEIANVLASKGDVSSRKTTRALTKIYDIKLDFYQLMEVDVKVAARLAKKYKTSVYDMLYAVVAKKHKVKLITADEKFVEQTGFKFIKLL